MPEDQSAPDPASEAADSASLREMRLTDTQRQILEALCRPRAEGNRYATAATNQEIAGEVYLSVDAVKAHLRVLYRKFGVEPLAHNQKRARLVELAIEGGLIEVEEVPSETVADGQPMPQPPSQPGPAAAESAPATESASVTEPAPASAASPSRRLSARLIAGAVLAVGVAGVAAWALSGGFDGSEETPGALPLTEPEYKATVNRACAGALPRPDELTAGATTAARARDYAQLLAPLDNTLDGIPPPAGDNPFRDEFLTGVGDATDLTVQVAQAPPGPGTQSNLKVVSDLAFAAGQVLRGATEYELSSACRGVADLVDASAENASRITGTSP